MGPSDHQTLRERGKAVRSHRDLQVYQIAFRVAEEIFRTSRSFPKEETYSLTDQIRRSSRSVTAQIAEAWRRRRYPAAFVSKLNEAEAEAEAAETQVWIEHAVKCGYLSRNEARGVYADLEVVLKMLVVMARQPKKWEKPLEISRSDGPKVSRSK